MTKSEIMKAAHADTRRVIATRHKNVAYKLPAYAEVFANCLRGVYVVQKRFAPGKSDYAALSCVTLKKAA